MHELALMDAVQRLAEREVRRQGASRIHRLQLRIGSLAGVDPDALQFAFDVVMAKRCSEGATLDLEVVATVCFCSHCRQDFAPRDVIYACPSCGALSAQVLQGRELELVALEVS
jgi:hydrogenase nickel incorporation protein HypA/HybF